MITSASADMADAQEFEIRWKKNAFSVIEAKEIQTKQLQMVLVGEENV